MNSSQLPTMIWENQWQSRRRINWIWTHSVKVRCGLISSLLKHSSVAWGTLETMIWMPTFMLLHPWLRKAMYSQERIFYSSIDRLKTRKICCGAKRRRTLVGGTGQNIIQQRRIGIRLLTVMNTLRISCKEASFLLRVRISTNQLVRCNR